MQFTRRQLIAHVLPILLFLALLALDDWLSGVGDNALVAQRGLLDLPRHHQLAPRRLDHASPPMGLLVKHSRGISRALK